MKENTNRKISITLGNEVTGQSITIELPSLENSFNLSVRGRVYRFFNIDPETLGIKFSIRFLKMFLRNVPTMNVIFSQIERKPKEGEDSNKYIINVRDDIGICIPPTKEELKKFSSIQVNWMSIPYTGNDEDFYYFIIKDEVTGDNKKYSFNIDSSNQSIIFPRDDSYNYHINQSDITITR